MPGSHQAEPEASADHQLISAPAVSLPVLAAKASNRGLQRTNPDRSSHLRFTFGQLWCHPMGNGGEVVIVVWGARRRGGDEASSQYNVCRVSAHPG